MGPITSNKVAYTLPANSKAHQFVSGCTIPRCCRVDCTAMVKQTRRRGRRLSKLRISLSPPFFVSAQHKARKLRSGSDRTSLKWTSIKPVHKLKLGGSGTVHNWALRVGRATGLHFVSRLNQGAIYEEAYLGGAAGDRCCWWGCKRRQRSTHRYQRWPAPWVGGAALLLGWPSLA
jgi:hypothetical protein